MTRPKSQTETVMLLHVMLIHRTHCSAMIGTSDLSTDITDASSSWIEEEPSTLPIPSSLVSMTTTNANKQTDNGASSPPSSRPKRKKASVQSDSTSSSNESDVDDSTQHVAATRTSPFAGRRVTSSAKTTTSRSFGGSSHRES